MQKIRKGYHFIVTPLIMLAALFLFILDNLNINVTPIASYMLKDKSF
jgi:hypothetical protein